MSRPGMIRADTLELQDHDAPSAQSHPHPHPNPHPQHDDAWGSGRSSHEGSELLEDDTDFLTDGGAVPMDMRADEHAGQQGASGRSSEDSDMADGDGGGGDDSADDDMMDKISSSPSINEDEDIDFEFVYALHTFVATVEGQANATKGDTMVLLDDSNSYWWLVRVVKDSSIGYLPAEHIETPTERLARLNKHRNTELAASMLSDTNEKTKNPLKKAMRRRNAKMVQFTAPTYFEASEGEWSDGDEDQEGGDVDVDGRSVGDSHQASEESSSNEATTETVATANGSAASDSALSSAQAKEAATERDVVADTSAQARSPAEGDQQAEDVLDANDENLSRSKAGNIRNTDSFFKDDTAEPKKMSLTPTLLRESEAIAESPRTSESHTEPSPIQDTFDQLDKAANASDKSKDDKRKKKPGMLSGLFKRKEKKLKVDEASGGTVRSSKDGEAIFGSPVTSPGESSNATPRERSPQPTKKSSGNKLVKSPPASATSAASNAASSSTSVLSSGLSSPPNGAAKPAPLSPSITTTNSLSPSQTSGGSPGDTSPGKQALRVNTSMAASEAKKEGGILSPLTSFLPHSDQPKKEKLKKAKQRIDLDVDSSPEREAEPESPNVRNASHTPPPRRTATAVRSEPFGDEMVSPVERHAPGYGSHDRHRSVSPISRSPSPETASTVQTPQSEPEPKTSTGASSMVPEHANGVGGEFDANGEPQWDDVALRHYLDERSHEDVKDLLLLVHDPSNVVPLPLDHETMIELGFHEQQKRLNAMSAQLDGMLHGFLARKSSKKQATKAPPA